MNKTKIAIELFDGFAEAYQEKFMNLEQFHGDFDKFCSQIRIPGAEILDLACGPGNITQYLLQKRPDFQILGTDLSKKMLELAEKNNPEAKFQILDLRKTRKSNNYLMG